ncbi:hypothetical protein LV89_00880 [Arcicella aurantiaca]|uniref:Beta-barrel porin n=1 Tax=Arcicella aurantiaca TaxID=591202 RepID=A0A316EGS7_9BACT|nr:DUF5686 family protein [Arcicella aurantiaca]PWK28674.1 hypothetical protein LV89_00880 [Arcicella aurantiaca]
MLQRFFLLFLVLYASDSWAFTKIFEDSVQVSSIIQKAIEAAPSHDKSYANYQAETFIQNAGKWNRIPNVWKSLLVNEGVEEGLVYQSESFAKFLVNNTNDYLFNYQAVRNNYKAEDRPDKFVNPNFYKSILGTGAISPISPKAFHYYHFKLLGISEKDGIKVFRIQVLPKHNNDEKVFSGEFSITDKDFSIQNIDLKVRNYAIDYHFQIKYEKYLNQWLPQSIRINISGNLMGFEGEFQYLAKVWNYQELSEEQAKKISRPTDNHFEEIVNVQERNFEVQQFKQVMSAMGTNLRNQWSDANIASGLKRYDKIEVSTEADKRVNNFWSNVKNDSDFQIFTPDLPIAGKNKNTLPPQPDEFSTYRQANQKFGIGSVLFSRSYFWGSTHRGYYPYEIYYKAPLLDFNFNTVEGFVHNTGAIFRYRKNRYDWWEIDPTWRYSYTQKRSMGMVKIRWKTQKEDFNISGGKFVSQYNVDTPIAFDLNSLATLLLKKNNVKIYEKEFVNISFNDRFSNTLGIKSSLEWARRYPLENTTDYNWINYGDVAYSPNFPKNQEIGESQFNKNDAVIASFQLNYRPFLKKQYRNNIRSVDFASSPLITFKYRGAIPQLFDSQMDFHTIELGITHNFPLGINTNFNYIAQAGTFLSAKNMTFADYKHFNGNNNMISIGDAITTHRLVGFYDNYVWGASKKLIDQYYYSTNGAYIDVMTMIGLRKFALTQLSQVRRLGLREELFANYLYTANNKIHNIEFGYGIDGIARILRVEAVFNYNSFGIPMPNNTFKNTQFAIRLSLNSRVRGGVTPDW